MAVTIVLRSIQNVQGCVRDRNKILTDVLCILKNIHHVDFSSTNISEGEAATIFYKIDRLRCHQPLLTVLNLKGNRIGVKGARAMSNSLQYWPNLQQLDLSGGSASTNVGEVGSERLSEKLHICTQLKRLSLSGNALTTGTGLKITANLLKCAQLTELNFSNNPFIEKYSFHFYPHVLF